MKQYRMVWECLTGCLPWQYDFNVASDIMAIEYTKRHVANSRGFQVEGMAMQLWRMNGDSQHGDAELIARFVLDRPTVAHVRNTLESGNG